MVRICIRSRGWEEGPDPSHHPRNDNSAAQSNWLSVAWSALTRGKWSALRIMSRAQQMSVRAWGSSDSVQWRPGLIMGSQDATLIRRMILIWPIFTSFPRCLGVMTCQPSEVLHHVTNVTRHLQSGDNLWHVIRGEQIRERGELRPVPGIILGLRAADQGLSQAVRGLGSNLRISKLLCLKLGRREGLEVVSSVSCLGCVRLTRADIWSE